MHTPPSHVSKDVAKAGRDAGKGGIQTPHNSFPFNGFLFFSFLLTPLFFLVLRDSLVLPSQSAPRIKGTKIAYPRFQHPLQTSL